MNLNEFIDSETKRLKEFEKYWIDSVLKEPELYPTEFHSVEDWLEQFNMFEPFDKDK